MKVFRYLKPLQKAFLWGCWHVVEKQILTPVRLFARNGCDHVGNVGHEDQRSKMLGTFAPPLDALWGVTNHTT